jgi:hypothetical protein
VHKDHPGPFNDLNAGIEEVSNEKKKLKVQVKIFGRATPVELYAGGKACIRYKPTVYNRFKIWDGFFMPNLRGF